MTREEFEIFASARGDEAFFAATCRAVYQELLNAGIDVQITKAALSDSRADPSSPYILQTDWSPTGIGAILAQEDADGEDSVGRVKK
ncbi:TPA: hypothetical protein ACH3X2_006450 [Trebouxia sp. C0005]